MDIFESKAIEILKDANKDDKVTLDPITIIMVIRVLIQAVKLYRDCNKPASKAIKSIKNPSFIDRFRFRRLVKKHVDTRHVEITESAYNIGKSLTLKELESMYLNAN